MPIAVAMSGGVDSSTAAALLVEERARSGEVIGLTMQLWNQRRLPRLLGTEESLIAPGLASGRCCSLDDVYDAKRVADRLRIPHYLVNYQDEFEERVVRPFVEGYLAAETPLPCALCNTQIKFEAFVRMARQAGAERIATGHYARIRYDSSTGIYRLLRGADSSKDQSYFLFGLTQAQLGRTVFPLGELTKEQVRAIARSRGLPVAEKPESQEICFVPTRSYRDFINAYLEEQGRPLMGQAGEIVSVEDRVLGEHQGLHHYTIGQRKGLGVAVGRPLYVIALDRANNRLVVGPERELYRRRFLVRQVNWIRAMGESESVEAEVKIRNKHRPACAHVTACPADGGSASEFACSGERAGSLAVVEFYEAQRAITPGQAAVFYQGEEVLGGGWIAKVLD